MKFSQLVNREMVDLSPSPAGIECKAKKWLSDGEMDRVQNATISYDNKGNVTSNLSAGKRERMLVQLVSWNLEDDAGKPVPITAENLKLLPSTETNHIFNELVKDDLSEEDKKK